MDQRRHLREQWYQRRRQLEEQLVQHSCRASHDGQRSHRIGVFRTLEKVVKVSVLLTGLHGRGRRNALSVVLKHRDLRFPDLPPAFDGYVIAHLSDLHVAAHPELAAVWADTIHGRHCDLAVITGDFQCYGQPAADRTGAMLAPLLQTLRPRDGIVAVLGNHDRADMADTLQDLGMTVLVNESHTLTRDDQTLHLIGLDDVHCFYTPAATRTLAAHDHGFRIALVHTVDMAGEAATLGYRLYLSGHTHGGQIALPGGRPLMTALDSHRRLACGHWRLDGLQGHTSPGSGSGTPTLRFNTRPEITLLHLRRG